MNNKQDLIQELETTHHKITSLINTLSAEELNIPYHPGVNPPIWEIGHTAFFYEEFILKALDGQQESFDPSMDDHWDSFNIDHKDRWLEGVVPSKQKTLHYVDTIFNYIKDRIKNNELTQKDLYLYKYSIFHQNMHIESLIWARQTSGYAKMEFDGSSKKPIPTSSENTLGDAEIPAGKYLIGMPDDSENFATTDFAFDNEKPWFEVELESFKISKTLVTNKEYLAFIEEGGYQNKEYWSFGGKKWLKTERQIKLSCNEPNEMRLPTQPRYWKLEKGQWSERFFDGWKPLVDDQPVTHVSFWEVEAYCNWAGRRLPTEYEWEAAALGNQKDQPIRHFPWGNTPDTNKMDSSKIDMDGRHLAQVPVTAFPEGDSPFGCRQMLGTVWEWTSSQYLPYDGFTMDMYVYMSTLQFGYHKTTKGGSCATSSILIRGSYRQAYYPTRTDVYVGFRTCAL